MSDEKKGNGAQIALVISIIVAALGSWVGVAGLTASIVQKQTQDKILSIAIDTQSQARIALEKIQAPTVGLESRTTKLEAIQSEVQRTLIEIRADVRKILEVSR